MYVKGELSEIIYFVGVKTKRLLQCLLFPGLMQIPLDKPSIIIPF